MDQTTKIAGALIAAYVLWVLLRGEWSRTTPSYKSIFFGSK